MFIVYYQNNEKNIIIIEEKNIQLLDKKMEQFNLMLILSDFEGNPWNPAKHDPFLVWNFIRGIGIGLLASLFGSPLGCVSVYRDGILYNSLR